jgi:hypothetical protein
MPGRLVVRGIAVFVGACLLAIAPVGKARATDLPLAGGTMRLVDAAGPAGQRNQVGFKDPQVTLTSIDPTVTGAVAYVGRPGTGTFTTLDLPASGWTAVGNAPRTSFKFKSRTSAVRNARLIDGRSLRFTARGAGAYALDGVPQGEVGVIVVIGDVRFCGAFGGDVTRDDGKRFRARRADAPAACPAVGPTTTTTTTTVTTTTLTTAPVTTTTSSTTSTTLVDCSAAAGSNARPDGCPCAGNNDCCGVCGGSVENPICGGIRKPSAPLACFGPECDFPSGANSRAAGCPCDGNNDCCAVCGGSVENPICGGIVKPDPPQVCLAP